MKKHVSFLPRSFFIRLFCVFLCLLFLPSFALAEGINLTSAPQPVRPGKSERYVFTASAEGSARISLLDAQGAVITVITVGQSVRAGENYFLWDGMTAEGTAPVPGSYLLRFETDTLREFPVVIGAPAPRITDIALQDVAADGSLSGTVTCSEAGTVQITLSLETGTPEVCSFPVQAGSNTFLWDGRLNGAPLDKGEYTLRFCLTDPEGVSGTRQSRTIEYPRVEMTAAPVPDVTAETTPAPRQEHHIVIPSAVTSPEDENNYWTYPIGQLDDEKVWEILMQPMTVIDGNQTEVYPLRATPDASRDKSNIVGEVTYASQGVHVLETLDNGWTYVEVYNTSYGPNCKSRRGYGVTNDLIRGYVKTSLLKTIYPYTEVGIVVDKLNQTMYIYENGKCTGTLLVSTGLNNKTQSWNETPSGEYVMISKVGGFPAGNLFCRYGMRINGGCCIHEVPYIGDENTPAARRDYSSQIRVLGQKASHGCIRVQKEQNEAGQNIKWLWDHMKINTKVLIWEDSGRFISYPDDSTLLYYNPTGGKNYHENQNCSAVKSRYLPLTAFTYGEFETGIYASLTPCATCVHNIRRQAEIDALNAANGF